MTSSPEELIRRRVSEQDTINSFEAHEHHKHKRHMDEQHVAQARILRTGITELAATVARTMTARDSSFTHAFIIAYAVSAPRKFWFAKRTVTRIAAWTVTHRIDGFYGIYLTREGVLVAIDERIKKTVTLDTERLPYSDLTVLEENLENLEHDHFFIEDQEALMRSRRSE